MEDYNINLSGQCSISKVGKKCPLNTSDYFFGLTNACMFVVVVVGYIHTFSYNRL